MSALLDDDDEILEYNRYRIGFTRFPEPNEKEMRYMTYLVAYDVCNPKRLRKVAKVCELYGVRIEKSVFECDLPDDQYRKFWKELKGIIDNEVDALISYRVCRACIRDIESIGQIFRPEKKTFYVL